MSEEVAQVNKQKRRRREVYVAILAIIVIVAAALILTQQQKVDIQAASYDNLLVPSGLLAQLNISNSMANQVGIGTANYEGLVRISGKNLTTLNGKPEILYLGADYCPFCAAERWGVVIALMRFGTLTNLHFMTSSATDYSPSTPTFTFYNSSYSSPYISFVSVEQTTNQPQGNNYAPLQQPNQSELNLAAVGGYTGSIPFIMFANRSAITLSNYDPLTVLGGKNWTTIAQDLYSPGSLQSSSIIGTANLITSQICRATNETPASVCDQPYVTQIQKLVG